MNLARWLDSASLTLFRHRERLFPLVILFTSAWLRFGNLGYADFQGDEIQVWSVPHNLANLPGFLLEQRKGPLQFLLAFGAQKLVPDFNPELGARLPYALFGVLGVLIFYALVRLHAGSLSAFFAAMFLATNGLFVGLTRIVQYQGLVLLFGFGALYLLSLAVLSQNWKTWGVYGAILCFTLGLLAHYDTLFSLPPLFFLAYRWQRAYRPDWTAVRRTWGFPLLISMAVLAVFYVPFAVAVGPGAGDYWAERLTGAGAQDLIPSSLYTFQLYNPVPLILWIYLCLALCALCRGWRNLPLIVWFLFPYVVLEVLVYDPGTHIYTYLLPVVILAGNGLGVVRDACRRWLGLRLGTGLHAAATGLLFLALFAVSHLVFVDHSPEYPWEARRIGPWELAAATDADYRVWAFGFPYYRAWEEIGSFMAADGRSAYYVTNENKSIAEYYLPGEFDSDRAGYYVFIHHPQSLRENPPDRKLRYWRSHYEPDFIVLRNGFRIVEVYLMPPGNMNQLRTDGY